MVGGIVTPPAFPGIAAPRAADGSEHVATENPGADVFKRLSGEIVVDASGTAAGLAVHLLEDLSVKEPGIKFEAACTEWVL